MINAAYFENVLDRLLKLEESVAKVRMQASATEGAIPHLATKADLMSLKGELQEQMRSSTSAERRW